MVRKSKAIVEPTAVENSTGSRLVLFLAMISGVCGLAYEILYVRIFSNFFGDGFFVSAVILTAVFLGISFGAWLSQRFVGYLALIEITIGVYAFLVAGLVNLLSFDIVTFGGTSNFLVALKLLVFLVVPTFLIGTCVPLFSRYLHEQNSDQSDGFTLVYAAYNFGAVASVLIIEFVLFRLFGLALTTIFIGTLNIALGITLLTKVRSPTETSMERGHLLQIRPALALFFVSLASGIFQLFYLRITYSIFGPMHENFAIILASSILGIALGAVLSMRMKLSFSKVIWLCVGCFVFFMTGLGVLVHIWSYMAGADVGEVSGIALKTTLLLLYPLPVFILLGAMVPLAYQEHQRERPSWQPQLAGQLLAVSSLANGLGALSIGLVLYQVFPLYIIGSIVGVLLVFAAFLAGNGAFSVGSAVGKTVLLAVGFLASYQLWPTIELNLGYRTLAVRDQLVDRKARFVEAVSYKYFGQDVSLVSYNDDVTTLVFNGYRSLTFGRESRSILHEQIVGVTPVLFGRQSENALVLGLGTGITAGSTARIFDRVKVVDINPAMINIPPHFKDANGQVLEKSNVDFTIQDGITLLLTDPQKYDAIINTVTSPQYYSASKLYTAEFFETAKRRLRPGGVYSGWFDLTIGQRGISLMLNTLEASFSNCRYFLLALGYFNAVCSDAPLIYQPSSGVDQKLLDTDVVRKFKTFGFEGSFSQILGDLEMDFTQNFFERSADGINTLDRPAIEFVSVRGRDRHVIQNELKELVLKNLEFRRKISFGVPDFAATCRNIARMSGFSLNTC